MADRNSGKTKIRFATWDVAEDVDKQQELVDKFNEEHDDIEVTLEAYGSDFDTKISAGMGSGDTPDVCICGITRHTTMDLNRSMTTLLKREMSTNPTSTTHSGITT